MLLDSKDTPRVSEVCWVYILDAKPEADWHPTHRRHYARAQYRYLDEIIPPAAMRDPASWLEWVMNNKERLLPDWARIEVAP
jgi:lysine/ornithine N-monooxygenase